MLEKRQIYVPLLGEGVDVWRPIDAEHVRGNEYRIVGATPEGESWGFQPGDLVRCLERTFADGLTAMVAVERVERDPWPAL